MPAAGDLRRLIAVLKINNDLERIADLAVNIAENARDLRVEPADLPVSGALRAIADHVVMDDDVDRLNGEVSDGAKAVVRSDPNGVDVAFRLFSVAWQLERIADHATNIAGDVVYLKEGRVIRHQSGRGAATRVRGTAEAMRRATKQASGHPERQSTGAILRRPR